MKLFLVFVCLFAVIVASLADREWPAQQNRRQQGGIRYDHPSSADNYYNHGGYDSGYSDPVYERGMGILNPSNWLPSNWLPKFPDFNYILMRAKNLWAGVPFQFASTAINQMCNIGIYTGLLKPSYVPDERELQLQFYSNKHSSYQAGEQYHRYGHDGLTSARLVRDDQDQVQNQDQEQYQQQNRQQQNRQQNDERQEQDQQHDENSHASNVTIFVTGWEAASDNPEYGQNTVNILSKAYKQRGGTHFVLYDVAKVVTNLYHWSTLNTVQVGEMLGEEIVALVQKHRFSPEEIHVIGHGVGAHVAGVAGRYVAKALGQQLARITGLDPSKICYDETRGFAHLQRGDAAFIDVIHSNNGVLGKKETVGDVDFYPNGQVALPPGCLDVVCAHLLVIRYYAESVIPGQENNFLAAECNSISDYRNQKCRGQKIPMGYATPSTARGTYYLYTNQLPPFGKNSS